MSGLRFNRVPWGGLRTPDLRARVEALDSTPHSELYAIEEDEREVGYFAIDDFPDGFNVTEIFIVAPERRRGVGAAALREALHIALARNRPTVTASPVPLDGGSREQLIGWYERHGFQRVEFPEGEVWRRRTEDA